MNFDGMVPTRPVICRKCPSDVLFNRDCREVERVTHRLARAHASFSQRCNDRCLPSLADHASANSTAATVDAVCTSKVVWYGQRRHHRELLLNKRHDYWVGVTHLYALLS
jgi:hypothetical protein